MMKYNNTHFHLRGGPHHRGSSGVVKETDPKLVKKENNLQVRGMPRLTRYNICFKKLCLLNSKPILLETLVPQL